MHGVSFIYEEPSLDVLLMMMDLARNLHRRALYGVSKSVAAGSRPFSTHSTAALWQNVYSRVD